MKIEIKTLFSAFLLFGFSIVSAQNSAAVVDYMKVNPGHWNDYLEVEKAWRKLHKARAEKGLIVNWQLYQKKFAAEDDPYQFITVAIYDDFKKTESPYSADLWQEVFSEEEGNKLMEKTMNSRKMVRTEVYNQVTGADNNQEARYILLNQMKVKPGQGWNYSQMERELSKPFFEASIEAGHHSSWSVWSKWPTDQEFQFVSVDGFSEYGQWNYPSWEDTRAVFTKAHPDKDINETMQKFMEARTMIHSELWELIDFVSADSDESTSPKP